MQRLQRHILPAVLAGAGLIGLALPAAAQEVGTRIEEIELDGWAKTQAKSYDDLFGRTVLIEFFAYW